jgi:hypothetical protein
MEKRDHILQKHEAKQKQFDGFQVCKGNIIAYD